MTHSEHIHGRNTIDIDRDRSLCYKAKQPSPNDTTQISPVEYAQTRSAIRNYNQYVLDKPMINNYAADVGKDPAITAEQLQGQAGADLAQKTKPINFNPNMGMPSFSKGALLGGKVMGDLGRDAISQRAAAQSGILQSKLGIQSNVNTAQEGMARDAVSRNISDSALEYGKQSASNNMYGSIAGAGAAILYNKDKKIGG